MHNYYKSIHVRDDFFINPWKVMHLGDTLEFKNDENWPGKRTINLFKTGDKDCIDFAKYFAKRIADEIFYGLSKFEIDIRFHKNDIYDVDEANYGWIHNDGVNFAGLVYLNQEQSNMDTGTSIFDKTTEGVFEQGDFESRKLLNLKQQVTEQYLTDLKNNHSNFTETIRTGNKFNRLIAYGADQWHRPNSYKVDTAPRYSLLFFINKAEFENVDSKLSLTSDWSET